MVFIVNQTKMLQVKNSKKNLRKPNYSLDQLERGMADWPANHGTNMAEMNFSYVSFRGLFGLDLGVTGKALRF